MKIGQKIKKLRKLRGLTQEEFSKILGYSDRSTISKIEKDINDVPTEKLEKIAKALGVSVSELLEDEKQPILDTSVLTAEEQKDLDTIFTANMMFFKNGNISDNDKKTLRQVITKIFLEAREEKNKKWLDEYSRYY